MQAGDFNKRITIEAPMTASEDSGDQLVIWWPFAIVWAQVEHQKGREKNALVQSVAVRRTVFRIRWRDGISPLHRVVFDGRVFDVQFIYEIGRRVGLELHTIASA